MYTIQISEYYRLFNVVKCMFSHVRLSVTPWSVACQAPVSMEFSRQEYWSGLPFPSLGNLPDPGIEFRSPALQADSLPFEPPGKPLTAEGLGSILGGGTKIPQAAWPKDKLKKKKSAQAQGFPGGLVVKNSPVNARDMGLIPGPGRSHMPGGN